MQSGVTGLYQRTYPETTKIRILLLELVAAGFLHVCCVCVPARIVHTLFTGYKQSVKMCTP
jgi:hypothetical protein